MTMSERWTTNATRSSLGATSGAGGSALGAAASADSTAVGVDSVGRASGGILVSVGGTHTFKAANGESGILRKTGHIGHGQENFDDLLVFGYSCKIFRNDEKARFIDQGRHLIPWMFDAQLKIDRYDVRGALQDLTVFEPPLGGYQDRLEGLSPAEQRAEQLCEEERYYSLYNNEVEEELYLEEAAKRNARLGNEIAFNYDGTATKGAAVDVADERTQISTISEDADDNVDPYVPPANFDISPDIALPDTMKEHAIIEKTARFIASQDAQMEILLKAKQANNPQFGFLNQSDRLFRYYRHVLLALKTNQYPSPVDPSQEDSNGAVASDSKGTINDVAQEKPKIFVPTIRYIPSVDCAYTQLISKITGAPIPLKAENDTAEVPTNPQQLTSLTNEFDYYPQECNATVSSDKAVEVKKVSTGLAGLVQYASDSENDDDGHNSGGDGEKNEQFSAAESQPAQNGKLSNSPFKGIVPSGIIQHVIDRTATYVVKNGYSFEEALRTKNDARFLFLNQTHEFYPYYSFRVQRLQGPFMANNAESSPNVTITTETKNGTVVETPSLGIKTVNTTPKRAPPPVTNIQHQKLGGPVCFSIKSKDDGAMPLKSTIIQELGGDEEDRQNEKESSGEEVPAGVVVPSTTDDNRGEVNGSLGDSGETFPLDKLAHMTSPNVCDPVVQPEHIHVPESQVAIVRDKLEQSSKEKQLERKKKASMFLSLIKTDVKPVDQQDSSSDEHSGDPQQPDDTQTPPNPPKEKNGLEQLQNQFADDRGTVSGNNDSDNDDDNVASVHSVSSGTPDVKKPSSDEDDVVLVSETRLSRSRSRSVRTDRSGKHKKKKSKSHHRPAKSKKKSRKRSRSRSRSRSRTRSRSRSKRQKRSRSDSREQSKSSHKSSRRKSRDTRSRSKSNPQARGEAVKRKSKHGSSSSRRRRRERSTAPYEKRRHRRTGPSTSHSSGSDSDGRKAPPDNEYSKRYPRTRGRYWDC